MILLEWFLEEWKEWKEKSTLEKILDVIGSILVIFYFVFLPALAFLVSIDIALNPW